MKLHIPPCEMDKMFFYDIMMLYNRYSDYVDKENEANKKEQERYSEEYESQKSEYSSMTNKAMNYNTPSIPSVPNYTAPSMPPIPSF